MPPLTLFLAAALAQGPQVGETFPDLPLPAVFGVERPFALGDWTGRLALIHVFASW